MANIGTYILTNEEPKKLSELTGIEFKPDVKYQMQNLGDVLFVCIGENGDGFRVDTYEKFIYETEVDDIYVKPFYANSNLEKKINIGEIE